MLFVNKKIRGTVVTEVDGIRFRSKLESKCYLRLKELPFEFSHESEKLILLPDFEPINISVLLPNKATKNIERHWSKMRPITYTPDFVLVVKPSVIVYIEVKGRANDVYPLKRKMILSYLNQLVDENKYIFAEVHSVKQLNQLIEYLKTEYDV